MNHPPILRHGTLADLDIITRFNLRMARETEDITLDYATARSGAEALVRDPDRGFYLIAEMDGNPAGQLMITPEWSDWRCAWFWWIQSVFVEPTYRRRGIFAVLFHTAGEMAKERGDVAGLRLYVDEGNQKAQATYSHLGMHRSNYLMYEVEFEKE